MAKGIRNDQEQPKEEQRDILNVPDLAGTVPAARQKPLQAAIKGISGQKNAAAKATAMRGNAEDVICC